MGEILEDEIRKDPTFYDRNISLICSLQKINIFQIELSEPEKHIFLSLCNMAYANSMSSPSSRLSFLPMVLEPEECVLEEPPVFMDLVRFFDYNQIYKNISSSDNPLLNVVKHIDTFNCITESITIKTEDASEFAKKLLANRGLTEENSLVAITKFSPDLLFPLEFNIYSKETITALADSRNF